MRLEIDCSKSHKTALKRPIIGTVFKPADCMQDCFEHCWVVTNNRSKSGVVIFYCRIIEFIE